MIALRSPIGCFAALLSMVLIPSAHGDEYTIRLERPESVGDTYTVSATGEQRTTTSFTLDGAVQPKAEQVITAQLDGIVKVLATAKNGHATQFTCTVTKCVKDGKPLLEKGTVVVAERKGKETLFTINDEKVPADTAKALSLVLGAGNPDDRNNVDFLYGTDQQQKVGGTWMINSESAAAFMFDSGLPIRKENIKGTGKLVAIRKINGQEALQVDGDISAQDLAGKTGLGTLMESGSLTAHFSLLVPSDPAGGTLARTMSTEMKSRVKGQTPDNKPIVVDANIRVKKTLTISDRKTAPASPPAP